MPRIEDKLLYYRSKTDDERDIAMRLIDSCLRTEKDGSNTKKNQKIIDKIQKLINTLDVKDETDILKDAVDDFANILSHPEFIEDFIDRWDLEGYEPINLLFKSLMIEITVDEDTASNAGTLVGLFRETYKEYPAVMLYILEEYPDFWGYCHNIDGLKDKIPEMDR